MDAVGRMGRMVGCGCCCSCSRIEASFGFGEPEKMLEYNSMFIKLNLFFLELLSVESNSIKG